MSTASTAILKTVMPHPWKIDPKIFLGGVISDAMDEIRAEQWFASHVSQHTAACPMKPVDRALGRILGHALDFVIKSPTIMAVEVTLELSE
jgi:hypothetical protein